MACSAGANFTPHVINVAAGEVCLLAPSIKFSVAVIHYCENSLSYCML